MIFFLGRPESRALQKSILRVIKACINVSVGLQEELPHFGYVLKMIKDSLIHSIVSVLTQVELIINREGLIQICPSLRRL